MNEPSDSLTAAPDDCADLAEVRAAIDQLDENLIALLARRQAYVEAGARFKATRGDLRDEGRIAMQLARARALARAKGLHPEVAEAIFRAMIEGFSAHELQTFDSRRTDGNPA